MEMMEINSQNDRLQNSSASLAQAFKEILQNP